MCASVCISSCGREDLGELFGAVAEDGGDVALDEEAVDGAGEGPAAGAVADLVAAEGAGAGEGLEGVGVVPEGVGAAELAVDEAVGGLPDGDLGAPANGEVADAEAVVEEEAGAHVDGAGGEDVEAEEGGGDGREVVGVGEEGEDPLQRVVQDLLGAEDPDPPEGGVTLGGDADGGGGGGGHGGEGSEGGGGWMRGTDLCAHPSLLQ